MRNKKEGKRELGIAQKRKESVLIELKKVKFCYSYRFFLQDLITYIFHSHFCLKFFRSFTDMCIKTSHFGMIVIVRCDLTTGVVHWHLHITYLSWHLFSYFFHSLHFSFSPISFIIPARFDRFHSSIFLLLFFFKQ